jgi:hypothetical protein
VWRVSGRVGGHLSAAREKWGFSIKVGWFMQPPDVPSPHTPCAMTCQ